MQLATVSNGGESFAAGVDPVRGVVRLSTLPEPMHGTVLDVLGSVSPAEFIDRIATAPAETFAPVETVTFLPPYRDPRKIWGIGLNYREHADDLTAGYPDEPASFVKGEHTIIGPGAVIPLPPQSERVTAEAELGIVFGSECRDVEIADAFTGVWGVCPILDQTAEDILQRNPRFLTRSKNFPGFFSFGPGITPLPEVLGAAGNLDDIEVSTVRNGSVHRSNVVRNMIFAPELLISFHSKVFPWYPGDILSTGTPGAVVIQDGDVAECRIDKIGELTNPVRAR
ncbi:MAG TPA: fumarylacetoacetate hydrolase family protein [Pseudonocardiaceae bacterium]|jgi:2-keto-4-pentenoate hydratase/2-oxohepta-3-ene-1,7-dioic acid hydratase in catechol pathway|nr:fumarylacetoacetate hydrolase family protein [Pseudonocardiaceae bacterium]